MTLIRKLKDNHSRTILKHVAFLGLIWILFSSFGIKEIKPNKIWVSNSTELKLALAKAQPGDEINLKDGIYEGKFNIAASGTTSRPITLTGSKNAILDAGSIETGYVLHLQANYCVIKGITLRNGGKGLVMDEASFNVIDGILITQIGEEGLHLRKFSKHNVVQNSEITYTGMKDPGYGEGIYIGSAYSNWPKYTNGHPDLCDSNQILKNHIGPYVAAESIDIKEGTTGGIIKGNTFDATGMNGAHFADSWLDVKGNSYQIEDNIGKNSASSALVDGYQVNCAYEGWGSYNEFKNNRSEVNSSGYGFNVREKSSKGFLTGTKIYNSNKVINAAKGVSNISLLTKLINES